jgi:hypothetical protein
MFLKEACEKEKKHAGEKAAVFAMFKCDHSFKRNYHAGVKSGEQGGRKTDSPRTTCCPGNLSLRTFLESSKPPLIAALNYPLFSIVSNFVNCGTWFHLSTVSNTCKSLASVTGLRAGRPRNPGSIFGRRKRFFSSP